MGRPFFLPPGVPGDRVAVVQAAFMKMVKDPAFLADAAKFNLEINDPKSGKEIVEILKDVYASPQDAVLAARNALTAGEIKMVRQAKKKKKKKQQ
jgi:tripartite-type tricarboxylate transporter receptor subunit TctC